MIESLVKSVESVFIQFSLGRLMYVLFILLLLGGALYLYNDSTGYALYGRIDNKITALERLHTLEKEGIKESVDLQPIYQSIVSELLSSKRTVSFLNQYSVQLTKVVSATFIFVIFVLYGLLGAIKGKKDSSSLVFGSLILTIMLGVPSWFIPVFLDSLWITSGALFAIQVALLFFIKHKYGDK